MLKVLNFGLDGGFLTSYGWLELWVMLTSWFL